MVKKWKAMKQTTWFTKGLRRGFNASPFWPAIMVAETNDLIYEGIATINSEIHFLQELWNETNDLIYEGIATPESKDQFSRIFHRKQTTWFTKGLRRLILPHFSQYQSLETNDLIYEGIATPWCSSKCFWQNTPKQTTWFTKGLRRVFRHTYFQIPRPRNKRPDLRRDCDLIP